MQQVGFGFKGSPEIETTSQANQEVIPSKENGKRYIMYKFSFKPFQDCHVIINDGDSILMEAGEWFSTESEDRFITSFKVVESGVDYRWIGGYKY